MSALARPKRADVDRSRRNGRPSGKTHRRVREDRHIMNVDERIAELTQRMLRRKFYAVLSQPSATPEKLKALLPASPTRRSIAPTALCAQPRR